MNFCHMDHSVGCNEPLTDYIRKHEYKFDIEGHKKILDTGVNISFDNFGNPVTQTSHMFNHYDADDYIKVSALYELVQQGYENQIMLGHDFTCRICGTAYGGYGYTRVPNFVCKILEQLGCGDAVYKMIVENPAGFLAY